MVDQQQIAVVVVDQQEVGDQMRRRRARLDPAEDVVGTVQQASA
jgi:hypothetical protein